MNDGLRMDLINQAIKDKLADLNWTLSEFDRIIEVILSNLITLKEEIQNKSPEKGRIASDFHDILNFKIETAYSLVIKLEELIFDTSFAYYKKYHGSIRGELSLVEFENVKREASYIFDSFLTQYKSLLDLTIKFAFSFCFAGQDLSWNVDSFDKLLKIVDERDKPKNIPRYSVLENAGVFSDLLNHRSSLEEITMYRHYIIHHGYVKHQLMAKSSEGHVLFSYWIPFLIKTEKKSYKIDPDTTLRIDCFCREKLYLLLSLIADLTNILYDDALRRPYIDKLRTLTSELVKEVLLKISKKEVSADMVLFENDLKAFLQSKSVDFSELVEDFVYTQREFEVKGANGKDISYLFERTHYKPIGNIRVFRSRYIFDRDWKPSPELFKTTYGVTISGVSIGDFISNKAELLEVLDTLRKAGLAYAIKSKEGIRYASIRNDLKSLVIDLDEMSHFKWPFIQIPEMKYFRPRTPEETEITRKIIGKGAEEFLKKEDEEKVKLLKEYEEWKKQPEHYFENAIDILDKNRRIVERITHKEFVEEKKVNFQNWKQNKKAMLVEQAGKMVTVFIPFFVDKNMDQKWLEGLVETCEKTWQGQPKHYLDMQKEWIEESKKKYMDMIKRVREEYVEVLKKYEYLIPVLRLLNPDVFT